MYLHRCAAILTFIVAGLVAPAAQATLHYEEHAETVEIGASATDRNSIWQAIRRFGPEAGGTHAAATTGAKTSWTRSLDRSPLGCKVKSINVTMNVTLALPVWQGIIVRTHRVRSCWRGKGITVALIQLWAPFHLTNGWSQVVANCTRIVS